MAGKAYFPTEDGIDWWRDIPGYGGTYRINRNAGIQRVLPDGRVRDMSPYQKQNKKRKSGMFVKLTKDGVPKEWTVLQLMAVTWFGSMDKNLVPYHKNGIASDDHISNIGFTDRGRLARAAGRMSDNKKSVVRTAPDGTETIYATAGEAARANYMSYNTMLNHCHGRVTDPLRLDGCTYRFEDLKGRPPGTCGQERPDGNRQDGKKDGSTVDRKITVCRRMPCPRTSRT